MGFQFTKHYSVEEAEEMIPQLRLWLTELRHHREKLQIVEDRLSQLMASGGDSGGNLVNDSVRPAPMRRCRPAPPKPASP